MIEGPVFLHHEYDVVDGRRATWIRSRVAGEALAPSQNNGQTKGKDSKGFVRALPVSKIHVSIGWIQQLRCCLQNSCPMRKSPLELEVTHKQNREQICTFVYCVTKTDGEKCILGGNSVAPLTKCRVNGA